MAAQPTPLDEAPPALAAGRRLLLKREDAHELGAFKWRGALPSLERYRDQGASAVVTASTGNHGAATAWAAQRTGLRAIVYVPEIASRAKLDLLESLGAELRQAGGGRGRGQGRGARPRRARRAAVLRGRRRAGPVRGLLRDRPRARRPARRAPGAHRGAGRQRRAADRGGARPGRRGRTRRGLDGRARDGAERRGRPAGRVRPARPRSRTVSPCGWRCRSRWRSWWSCERPSSRSPSARSRGRWAPSRRRASGSRAPPARRSPRSTSSSRRTAPSCSIVTGHNIDDELHRRAVEDPDELCRLAVDRESLAEAAYRAGSA